MTAEKTIDELRASGVRKVKVVSEEELQESMLQKLLKRLFGDQPVRVADMNEAETQKYLKEMVEVMRSVDETQKKVLEYLEALPRKIAFVGTSTDSDPASVQHWQPVDMGPDTDLSSNLDDIEIESSDSSSVSGAADALKKLKGSK